MMFKVYTRYYSSNGKHIGLCPHGTYSLAKGKREKSCKNIYNHISVAKLKGKKKCEPLRKVRQGFPLAEALSKKLKNK